MRFVLSLLVLSLAFSATAENPEDLVAARRLFDSGDLDGAAAAARAILEATPDATRARALLGIVRFQQAEAMPQSARTQAVEAYREARRHFEMAEKSMSELPPHLDVSFGVALSETGETEAGAGDRDFRDQERSRTLVPNANDLGWRIGEIDLSEIDCLRR